jgi:hypothetical protein
MRGQGAVEAIVALPVFLLLVCILLQLFVLALAQVQLRYAAFCAARVGAVRNADIKEMKDAVGKVLSRTPGFIPGSAGAYWVEKIDLLSERDRKNENDSKRSPELLKIRVHWNYPLSVPFLDTLWAGIHSDRFFQRTATVPLNASWTTIMFEEIPEKTDDKKHPRI